MEQDDDLKRKIKRMWAMRKTEVIPIVVGALGAVSRELNYWIEKLDIHMRGELLQKDIIAWNSKNTKKLGKLKNPEP